MRPATGLRLEAAHSVIYVKDVDRMVGFYRDVLGFEVSDRGGLGEIIGVDAELVFMSQAGNHHHQVAFMTGSGTTEPSNNYHHSAYRSSGTLDDLRSLLTRLQDQPDVTGIMPLNHGNAWSIYFQDPENNGVEVFIDSPFHVAQPAGVPLDLSLSDDGIREATIAAYEEKPQFGDLGEFYERRTAHFNAR